VKRAEALAAVRRGLERVGELGLDGLGHEELSGLERELRGIIDQAELLAARVLAAVERCGGYRADGAGDLTSWMVQTCRMTPEAAHDRVTVARSLESLTATADLLAHGELNFEQVTVVARSAEKVRPEDAPRVEGMVLAKALTTDAGQLRRHAAAAVAEVDGEALARDARRAREKRSFNIGPDVDGSARVSGDLTSELAALLRLRLEPFMAPAGKEDPRTAAQRRHDALLECLGRGDGGRQVRQLVVVAPLSAMRGEDGPPALLQGLVPLSQEALAEVACDSALSVVLKDDKGNIAWAGKAARTFSPAKRRAMLAKQPTCAFQGCNRPAMDCDGHHVKERCLGGETTVEDEAPLCPAVHHPMVHRDGWAVLPDGNGGFRTLPPGHPDNPNHRLSPEEYLRRRDAAIRKRKAAPPVSPDP